jgi:hypothetical protein
VGLKPRANRSSTEAKTRPGGQTAQSFIAGLSDERRQRECKTLLTLMTELTGEPPVMWGSIVGFGTYHYKYASGREGDWPRTAFSPRKQSITVYCMPGFKNQQDLLSRLGPHKTSVSCLYIRKLEDVDLGVLREVVARSLKEMQRLYGN